MLKTISLSKVYRAHNIETTALARVNITVHAGEFVAVIGPSGCGKSTLLNMLGLLDTPTSGDILFKGRSVAFLPEKRRALLRQQHIGFVFQNFNLIDELTVYENISLPLLYRKVPRGLRKKRVQDVMEQLSLIPRRHHHPQQLSGGQQQRVAVARAVVGQPEIVLADEPTGNLDSRSGEEVMQLLSSLNGRGTTVVMVTHSPMYAEYSQRVVHLFDGHIVSENYGRE